jgi:hypothetical protein
MAERSAFDAARDCFGEAERLGFPAFLTPIAESNPVNATPYLCRYEDFRATASTWAGRKGLLAELERVRSAAEGCGVSIDAILIGGSFTDLSKPDPADVDCLLFYRRAAADNPVEAKRLAALRLRAKAAAVDLRFIPVDGDPLPLIKSVSYFTSLFSQDKPAETPTTARSANGLVLVDCRA